MAVTDTHFASRLTVVCTAALALNAASAASGRSDAAGPVTVATVRGRCTRSPRTSAPRGAPVRRSSCDGPVRAGSRPIPPRRHPRARHPRPRSLSRGHASSGRKGRSNQGVPGRRDRDRPPSSDSPRPAVNDQFEEGDYWSDVVADGDLVAQGVLSIAAIGSASSKGDSSAHFSSRAGRVDDPPGWSATDPAIGDDRGASNRRIAIVPERNRQTLEIRNAATGAVVSNPLAQPARTIGSRNRLPLPPSRGEEPWSPTPPLVPSCALSPCAPGEGARGVGADRRLQTRRLSSTHQRPADRCRDGRLRADLVLARGEPPWGWRPRGASRVRTAILADPSARSASDSASATTGRRRRERGSRGPDRLIDREREEKPEGVRVHTPGQTKWGAAEDTSCQRQSGLETFISNSFPIAVTDSAARAEVPAVLCDPPCRSRTVLVRVSSRRRRPRAPAWVELVAGAAEGACRSRRHSSRRRGGWRLVSSQASAVGDHVTAVSASVRVRLSAPRSAFITQMSPAAANAIRRPFGLHSGCRPLRPGGQAALLARPRA